MLRMLLIKWLAAAGSVAMLRVLALQRLQALLAVDAGNPMITVQTHGQRRVTTSATASSERVACSRMSERIIGRVV